MQNLQELGVRKQQKQIIQQVRIQKQQSPVWLQELYCFKKKAATTLKQVFPKCVVCKKPGKYKCPKCNVRYCSIQHYRSHNLFCSQNFHKQNVQNELKNIKVTKEQRQKTKKLVQKYEEEVFNDEIMETMSEQRLQEINKKLEDGVEVYLTHSEEVQFAKFVRDWAKENCDKQFWQVEDGISYLLQRGQDLQVEQYNSSDYQQFIIYRQLLRDKIQQILPFHHFLTKIPNKTISPAINYQLFYLVYVGCLLYRYFDSQSVLPEFYQYFVKLTKPIFGLKGEPKLCSDLKCTEEAYCIIENLSFQCDQEILKWLYLVLDDCSIVIKNKYLILQMLFRLMECINNKKLGNKNTKTIIIKKLQFLISLVNDGYFTNQIRDQILQQIVVIKNYRSSINFKPNQPTVSHLHL